MARSSLALSLVALATWAGCTTESAPSDGTAADPQSEVAEEVRDIDEADELEAPGPQTVFDAAEAVFDTLEPPQRPGIDIPEPSVPRPPLPRPRPDPLPTPVPLPPPLPAPPVAGSCDVTGTESYCFTYTGAAWSAASAEDHCAAAPDATFRAAECPAQGRIGTCVFRRGETPSREIIYHYYEPYDLGLARLACPGRFTEE